MTPFDDEQHRYLSRLSDASYSQGTADTAMEMIRVAAYAYFAHRPATDGEAAGLVDIIMGALGEAEQREIADAAPEA